MPATKLDDINKINGLRDILSTDIYGITDKLNRENQKEFERIKKYKDILSQKFESRAGFNGVELYTKAILNGLQTNSSGKINFKKLNKDNTELLNITNNLGLINNLFIMERPLHLMYQDIDNLERYITFISQGIDIITDNIISPDDFTKSVLIVNYDEGSLNNDTVINKSTNDKNRELVETRLKLLKEKYRLDENCRKYIRDACKYGNMYLAVLSLDEEFDKLLKEEVSYKKTGIHGSDNYVSFNENANYCRLESTELNEIKKYIEYTNLFNENKINTEELTEEALLNDIKEVINKNVIFSSKAIFSEQIEHEGIKSEMSDLLSEDEMRNITILPKPELMTLKNNKRKNNEIILNAKNKNGSKEEDTYFNGSYLRPLEPERVVKIYSGTTNFGYFYIEITNDTANLDQNNVFHSRMTQDLKINSTVSTMNMTQAPDILMSGNSGTVSIISARDRLLADIFIKNIANKMNKKFLIDNPEFKEIVYELLKKDYIIKKQVRVIYFRPDQVIHFMPRKNYTGMMGSSILEKVIFSAKLYLAVLICNVMLKLTRSYERRTYYLDVGLSNDMEEEIQGLMRDIKSSEISMTDLESTDTILNIVGVFKDLIIPTKGGETPVRIDSTPGIQAEIENDLIDYLKKIVISGMGIPPTFLSMLDEVEYARELTVMNGIFLRMIISFQVLFNDQFTDLIRILYKNEFKNDKANIDINKIFVKLPTPMTLGINNFNELSSSTQSMIDFLAEKFLSEDDLNNSEIKKNFTIELIKKYMPNVDVDFYTKLVEKVKQQDIKEQLMKDNEENSDMSGI